MDELEEIKKRRLDELKSKDINEQIQQQAKVQQEVEQLENAVKQYFTKEALERYGNLKAAHPEKALQLIVILAQASQSGQLGIIDDARLKEILKRITPKKDFKIKRV